MFGRAAFRTLKATSGQLPMLVHCAAQVVAGNRFLADMLNRDRRRIAREIRAFAKADAREMRFWSRFAVRCTRQRACVIYMPWKTSALRNRIAHGGRVFA
jgi:hypothetical protein